MISTTIFFNTMTKQQILDAIQEFITANGLQEITGQILNTILASIANIIPDETMLTSSYGGIVTPASNITVVPNKPVWFFAKPGTYSWANNIVAESQKLNILSFNGTTWEIEKIEISSDPFTEEQFDNEALKYADIKLISKDLSAVNFTNSISAGAGSSIFTTKLTAPKKIKKLRVKVSSGGLANFTARRLNQIVTIRSGVTLVAGWNEVFVDYDGLTNDYIGFSTSTSTATLLFMDGGDGHYYSIDNASNIVEWPGNIALEVYEQGQGVNSFKELVTKQGVEVGTKKFEYLSKYSQPQLRRNDYGVVSVFNLPDLSDALGNNKIKNDGNVIGNFSSFDSRYIFSLGFSITFPAKYTSTKDIATFDFGAFTMKFVAGGSGIGVYKNSEYVGKTYDYGDKQVNFVILADAYFIYVLIGSEVYTWVNIGKKLTKLSFQINQDSSQVVNNVTYWNRRISNVRALEWMSTKNPFKLKQSSDRLYPQEGIKLAANVLDGNQYFDPNTSVNNANGIFGEQSVVKFKGKYYLYFTAAKSSPSTFIESGVAVAVSNRPDGGFMMYTDDVVIGGGRNKAGVPRAMGSWAGVIGDYVYVFASMEYITSGGAKIFKSSDGLNFTLVGDFVSADQIPKAANIAIYPEKQSNGFYYGVIEGMVTNLWEMYLVKSTNLESGWQVVGKIQGVKPYGADRMAGGPNLHKSANGDRWILFYHAAHEMGGNVPTANFHAFSSEIEPLNWTNITKDLDITDHLPEYNAFNCDQVATPFIFQDNGKIYYSYCLAQNEPSLYTQLRTCLYDGTIDEFVGLAPNYASE